MDATPHRNGDLEDSLRTLEKIADESHIKWLKSIVPEEGHARIDEFIVMHWEDYKTKLKLREERKFEYLQNKIQDLQKHIQNLEKQLQNYETRTQNRKKKARKNQYAFKL